MSNEEAPKTPTELDMLKERARIMGITFSNNIGLDALKAKVNAKIKADGAGDNSDAGADLNGEDDDDISDEEEIVEDVVSEQDDEVVQANTGEVVSASGTVAGHVTEANVLASVQAKAALEVPSKSQKATKVSTQNKSVAPENETEAQLRMRLMNEANRLVRIRIQNLDPKKKDLPGEIITVANEYVGTIRKFVPFGEATDEGYHVPYAIYNFLKKRKFLQIRKKNNPRTNTPIITSTWMKEFAIEELEPLTQEELDNLATAQIAAGSVE